jgi:tripartite-type tricarboxylate transporter receptor subunit TctC
VPVRLRSLTVGLALLGTLAPLVTHAETVEEFYKKNHDLTLLIGQGSGSSHEVWARLIGQFLGKHIPGEPTIVVRAMPGAGSLIMANFLYNQAPKDGSYIAAISANLPSQVLVGLENAQVDPQKLLYIGSSEQSDHGCTVATKTGVKSVEDAKKQDVPLAGTGPTTNSSFMPPIVNKMVGTRFKVIEGYRSTGEAFLAMERGEVWGGCSKLDSVLRSQAENIKSGAFKVIYHYNRKPSDLDPSIPTIFDYLTKTEDIQTMSFIRASTALGRPYVAPPGVPQDRFDALRKGFADTLKDPEFLAAAQKQKLTVTFTPGDELAKFVTELYKTPPDLVKQAAAMLPEGGED